MSGEITLPLGASAEYNTCGSCKFFKRTDMGGWVEKGECKFVLPPLMERYAQFVYPKDQEFDGWGPRSRKDSERCDCYQSDGKVYIMQIKVGGK